MHDNAMEAPNVKWTRMYRLAALSLALVADAALAGDAPLTGTGTPAAEHLLPLGDALVFGSIGSVIVLWLRERRRF